MKSCDYVKVIYLFDYEGIVFFVVFMLFWVMVFLEVWRRCQISLVYEWDMLYFEEEFEFLCLVFVIKVQNKKLNFVIGKFEFYILFMLCVGKFICGFMIVLFMVLLVIVILVGVVIYWVVMVVVLLVYFDEDV